VVALAVVGSGVWFALGRSGDDDAAAVAKESPSASAPDAGPSHESLPTDQPSPEASPSPERNPDLPQPTGTGLQAVWKGPSSVMLALGEPYVDEPTRINAVFVDGAGLECKGRWQKDRSSGALKTALLCSQDGTRVENKDRLAYRDQNGDTLTVKWAKGATGEEEFTRFRDMDTD